MTAGIAANPIITPRFFCKTDMAHENAVPMSTPVACGTYGAGAPAGMGATGGAGGGGPAGGGAVGGV